MESETVEDVSVMPRRPFIEGGVGDIEKCVAGMMAGGRKEETREFRIQAYERLSRKLKIMLGVIDGLMWNEREEGKISKSKGDGGFC